MKVYSTFACGGGSTMGYKLAGFEVIGANDIDKKMAEIYQKNHKPKYYHLMDIRSLVGKKDLPDEMFDLDILDGSPPCSTFSLSGKREEDWGKKKKFKEGQTEQTLDDLFFDFIDLAARLKPKIVVAENVKDMLAGNAKRYVWAIKDAFEKAGYDTQLFLLNGAAMGVPQRRERVFFIGRRKDLNLPKITLDFNEKPVFFKDIRTDKGLLPPIKKESVMFELWQHRKMSDVNFSYVAKRILNRDVYFNSVFIRDNKVPNTLASGSNFALYDRPFWVSTNDLISIQTFPQDYDFGSNKYDGIKYVLGMSVPPLMIAGIAKQIEKQLLKNVAK